MVKTEGDPADYFKPFVTTPSAPVAETEGDALDVNVFYANWTAEDILLMQNQGLDVDDDNAPAPENIPTANASIADQSLHVMRLFAGTIIKKHCFWPTNIPGVAMEAHFQGMNIGDVDAIQGTKDGFSYTIWGMKDPNHVMSMMVTGGALIVDDTCKMVTRGMGRDKVRFCYTLPYDWHFCYRHAVDDHS